MLRMQVQVPHTNGYRTFFVHDHLHMHQWTSLMHSLVSGVNGLVIQDSLVGPPISFLDLGPQLADGASPVWTWGSLIVLIGLCSYCFPHFLCSLWTRLPGCSAIL